MFGVRATWWFLGLGMAGTLAAVSAGSEGEPPPSSAPVQDASQDTRATPDEATVLERQRRAVARFLARRERRRPLTVTVLDCHQRPAPSAELDIVAGGERLLGRASDEGAFRTTVLAGAREIGVSAVAGPTGRVAHRGAAALTVPQDGAERLIMTVSVCPGATIFGRVEDTMGRPVAGAWVALGDDIALTEEDGEFTLTDLWLEGRSLSISHAIGVIQQTIEPLSPGEERRLVLRLEEGRRAVGVVVDARGDPVANAEVTALDTARAIVARTRSDRQGRFWLKRLPLETLTLRANGGSSGMGELPLGARAGSEALVLRLMARGILVVRWRGPPGEKLWATPEEAPWEPAWEPGDNPWVREVRSDDETPVLAPRYWRVEVVTEGGLQPCGEGLLNPGGRLEITCGAPGPAEIVGQVVAEDGRPLTGSWTFHADGVTAGALDSAGRFAVRRVIHHGISGRLVVTTDDGRTLERRAVVASPGDRTDLGRLVMLSWATLEERFPEGGRGPFGGIGARVGRSRLGISLTAIVEGGPLDAAGILAGDVVIAVDGTPAGNLSVREAIKHMRGRPGTPLHLQLLRPDSTIFDIDIERAMVDPRGAVWVD